VGAGPDGGAALGGVQGVVVQPREQAAAVAGMDRLVALGALVQQ
jgi:hypothetical protein